jgi:maltooligosyltrehalose trehalohydrolase
MLEWYRALIGLRRSTPCLNDGTPGNTRVTFDEQANWLRMDRGNVAVICNLGEEFRFPALHGARVLLASQDAPESPLTLTQDSVVILKMPDSSSL